MITFDQFHAYLLNKSIKYGMYPIPDLFDSLLELDDLWEELCDLLLMSH